MEGYIKKINDKLIKENSLEKAMKTKQRFLIAGGTTLGLGLAGFVSAFITFMVLFLLYQTDKAFIAWLVAIPFILMIVAGSVVTRVGDMLLREGFEKYNEEEKKNAINNINKPKKRNGKEKKSSN